LSYREIAAVRGCSVSSAFDAVRRALGDVPLESAEELRRIELETCSEMHQEALRQLRLDHVMVSHGKVVHGVVDEGAKLAAMDRLLKIQERRARYSGLDAPRKAEVTVITEDALTAKIRELELELADDDRVRRLAGDAQTPA
jgi:hypothetical protein